MADQLDDTSARAHERARAHVRVRDKEGTRQRLLDAAEEIFADKGYHATAVDDITQKTDTSKGGFYFHFASKEAIFLALIDSLTPRLESAIERALSADPDPVAQLDAALRTALTTFAKHQQLSKILLIEAVGLGHGFDARIMQVRGRFAALIQRRLDLAVASGQIAPMDTETVAWAWFGAINEIVTRWLVSGQPRNLDAVFPTLRAVLLRSIGVDPTNTSATLSAKEPQA